MMPEKTALIKAGAKKIMHFVRREHSSCVLLSFAAAQLFSRPFMQAHTLLDLGYNSPTFGSSPAMGKAGTR